MFLNPGSVGPKPSPIASHDPTRLSYLILHAFVLYTKGNNKWESLKRIIAILYFPHSCVRPKPTMLSPEHGLTGEIRLYRPREGSTASQPPTALDLAPAQRVSHWGNVRPIMAYICGPWEQRAPQPKTTGNSERNDDQLYVCECVRGRARTEEND